MNECIMEERRKTTTILVGTMFQRKKLTGNLSVHEVNIKVCIFK